MHEQPRTSEETFAYGFAVGIMAHTMSETGAVTLEEIFKAMCPKHRDMMDAEVDRFEQEIERTPS